MSREKNNLIAGLDIGSSFVKLAIGSMVESGRGEELQILGVAKVVSEGVNKGVFSSIEDVVSSVSSCLEQAERIIGAPIDTVWAGISGNKIIVQNSRGHAIVSKADNEITEQDVERAIETSKSIATPLNYEVLHVAPYGFSVDGQPGIKDPVGMTGVRLEVDTKIVLGQSSQIKNITRAIYRTGTEIEDVVLSILAEAELLLSNKQKELGVVLIDIGGQTTSLAVYEEGELLHTATIPVGSAHITNDLAVGLRTSVEYVEKIKLQYAECLSGVYSRRRGEIDLQDFGAPESEPFKLKDIDSIIGARVEEMMSLVERELRSVQKNGMLPAGAVFTGGGSKLPGITELAKNILRLPTAMGQPFGFTSAMEKAADPSYSSAVGLVKYGSRILYQNSSHGSWHSGKGVSKIKSAFKKAFKSIIP